MRIVTKEQPARTEALAFRAALPVQPGWAGQLVSRGIGRHPRRRMSDYELIFVREGILEIAEEAQLFRIEAGQTLLLFPNRQHYGTAEYGPDLSFFWVHFMLRPEEAPAAEAPAAEAPAAEAPAAEAPAAEAPAAEAPAAEAPAAEWEPGLFQIPQAATVSRPDYLAELFRRYIDDFAAHRQDPVAGGCLIQLMLREVSRPETVPAGSASVRAAQADSFIRTHFHLPLSASVVAAQVGCHPRYLSRVYRAAYGATLTEAIQRTRIDYGCRLLLGSNLRVGEIARACGLDDPDYFHQVFKRRKGLTPSAYRRLHAPVNVNTE